MILKIMDLKDHRFQLRNDQGCVFVQGLQYRSSTPEEALHFFMKEVEVVSQRVRA